MQRDLDSSLGHSNPGSVLNAPKRKTGVVSDSHAEEAIFYLNSTRSWMQTISKAARIIDPSMTLNYILHCVRFRLRLD